MTWVAVDTQLELGTFHCTTRVCTGTQGSLAFCALSLSFAPLALPPPLLPSFRFDTEQVRDVQQAGLGDPAAAWGEEARAVGRHGYGNLYIVFLSFHCFGPFHACFQLRVV